MRHQNATPDLAIARIAERQHGVASHSQLRAAGVSAGAIARRSRSGRLHRLHRGVYAVGHACVPDRGRWMAAVLACGVPAIPPGAPELPVDPPATDVLTRWGAALSHRGAAELWLMLPAQRGPVDVTVPGDGGRNRREGIRIHRSKRLAAADVTTQAGIPVTTPTRTLADLREASRRRKSGVATRDLRRAIRQAEFLRLPIDSEPDTDRTRSELEAMFLRLCRRHELPVPEVNVRVGPLTVDFLWRDRRLVVETDGYRSHRGRQAFEDDRARDLRLRALGYDVVRLSYRQVLEEPDRVAAALRADLLDDGKRAG